MRVTAQQLLSNNIGRGSENKLSKIIGARHDELGLKFETSGTSSSDINTRRRNCIMSWVTMRIRSGFIAHLSMRSA